MRFSRFKELCEEEFRSRYGDVCELTLSPGSSTELANDVLNTAETLHVVPHDGCGYIIDQIVNPVTKTAVRIKVRQGGPPVDWATVRVPVPACRRELATVLRDLAETHLEYEEFLNEANKDPIFIAANHGWHCPDVDVNRGIVFRARIDDLRREAGLME